MLCQSTFSCVASVDGSSIDTWTDRHAIICYFSAGLPLNWRIGTGLADWHRIGKGSANFMPLLRTIPALNLGTSPLYGMVPSLLGGRNVRNNTRSASTCDQSITSPWPILSHSLANPEPILLQPKIQSWSNPKSNLEPFLSQSYADLEPIPSQSKADPEQALRSQC